MIYLILQSILFCVLVIVQLFGFRAIEYIIASVMCGLSFYWLHCAARKAVAFVLLGCWIVIIAYPLAYFGLPLEWLRLTGWVALLVGTLVQITLVALWIYSLVILAPPNKGGEGN